jgi:hypothetical protein
MIIGKKSTEKSKIRRKNRQKNCQEFDLKIRQKNSSKKFVKKIRQTRNPKEPTPSNDKVTEENGPIFICPISVTRSSARPSSGRRV